MLVASLLAPLQRSTVFLPQPRYAVLLMHFFLTVPLSTARRQWGSVMHGVYTTRAYARLVGQQQHDWQHHNRRSPGCTCLCSFSWTTAMRLAGTIQHIATLLDIRPTISTRAAPTAILWSSLSISMPPDDASAVSLVRRLILRQPDHPMLLLHVPLWFWLSTPSTFSTLLCVTRRLWTPRHSLVSWHMPQRPTRMMHAPCHVLSSSRQDTSLSLCL